MSLIVIYSQVDCLTYNFLIAAILLEYSCTLFRVTNNIETFIGSESYMDIVANLFVSVSFSVVWSAISVPLEYFIFIT